VLWWLWYNLNLDFTTWTKLSGNWPKNHQIDLSSKQSRDKTMIDMKVVIKICMVGIVKLLSVLHSSPPWQVCGLESLYHCSLELDMVFCSNDLKLKWNTFKSVMGFHIMLLFMCSTCQYWSPRYLYNIVISKICSFNYNYIIAIYMKQ
jgi:hypothetical protein